MSGAMARASSVLLIPLLLTCIFQTSGNRVVQQQVRTVTSNGNIEDLEGILSQIPGIIPQTFGPKNISVTSVVIKTCTGMKERLAQLESQLRETTRMNSQLDIEVSGLKKEIRQLNVQVSTCKSPVTGGSQLQLQKQIKRLLETLDGNTSVILQAITLTRQVSALQRKVKRAENATESASNSKVREVLQAELKRKSDELNLVMQELERLNPEQSALLLQIISLQNQIWYFEQAPSREELQLDNKLLALQNELDKKIKQLASKGNAAAALLELISVQSKIALIQRLISVHIEESNNNYAIYKKQWKLKLELLKKKVLDLSSNVNNTETTMEILQLQTEVEEARQLMASFKKMADSRFAELRVMIDTERKRQQYLQEQLEGKDYPQAQMFIKVIRTMRELREMEGGDDDEDPGSSQTTNLQILLKAKEAEYAEAQAEIKELQEKLKNREEMYYKHMQTEFEKAIETMGKTGESETAFIVSLIRLQDEIQILEDRISKTDDVELKTELQKQLEKKQEELLSKMKVLKETPNTNQTLILAIIEQRNDLWDLQKTASSESDVDRIRELQKKMEGLISQVRDNENMKMMLKVTALQNQVAFLQKTWEDFQASQTAYVSKLTNELMNKKKELRRFINEVKEKNQTNARLILSVTELRNQLLNLEQEKQRDNATTSLTVIELREQLKETVKENAQNHAQIKALKVQLQGKEAINAILQAEVRELQSKLLIESVNCYNPKEKYENVKTEFEKMIAEMNRTGNQAGFILTLMWTKAQEEMKPDSEKKNQNTLDLILKEAGNSEDTKLIIKVIKLQNDVWELLQKQMMPGLQPGQAAQLTNDLTTKRKELQKYTDELNEKYPAKVDLVLTATNLYNQLRKTYQEKDEEDPTELRKQLEKKTQEHDRYQAEIKRLEQQLNLTETQCSGYQVELKGVQTDLDAKMKELQSKSDSVTSLTLQVSTLTAQVAELNKQLEGTVPESQIKELQKIINEKNTELANKIQQLKAKSSQPQRILQIVMIQTEIEKLANKAESDDDFETIKALRLRLNQMIEGVQDEKDENTRLIFKMLAQQEEMAALKKQKEKQTQARLEIIKTREDEIENLKKQLKEKKDMLTVSDTNTAQLTAEIMELRKKIKLTEDEVLSLQQKNAESLREIQQSLDLSQKQLKDTEDLLKEADRNNFDSIKEITDLRMKLKKAGEKAAEPMLALEKQIQTLQRESRRLETENNDLQQKAEQLQNCCDDPKTPCEELEKQLQKSNEDVDRMLQQLSAKDAKIEELTQDSQKQRNDYSKLVEEYNRLQQRKDSLEKVVQDLEDRVVDRETTVIYTTKVRLDPLTANARVVLSADDTEMTTTAELQNVLDHPGRFDVMLAALGATGFSSGRHYWEVSVIDKKCYHIGMASESAERRGVVSVKPLTGYWTIIRTKLGQYRAMDRKISLIEVKTEPMTLGILLDYKRGQISFYDAGTRSHLYSFLGHTFTDKIYPFINFCVEDVEGQTPIVLITPGSTDWIKDGTS